MEKQPPNRMPQYTDDWLQTYRNQGVYATVGRYTYGRPGIQFRPAEIKVTKLCIGAFCSIARGCTFKLGSELMRWMPPPQRHHVCHDGFIGTEGRAHR
jgi:hypothetical protein